MTIGTREHATLASDAYEDRSRKIGKVVPAGGVDYLVLDIADRPSGYQATAYQRAGTGEVIIAHRGTESLKDAATDASMALHGRNSQLDDAIAFTQRAIEKAKESEAKMGHPVAISITGHSLGGTLAELTAAKFNLPAETFNAYGPADLKDLQSYGIDDRAKYPNIVNHVRATDVVGAGGHHLGEVRTYATGQDVESLRRGRYLDAPGLLRLPTNPLLTADFAAHKMGNFLSSAADASIITAENEARAQAYRGPIEHYHQDVANNRIDLATIANRVPSPLHAINPLDSSAKLRLQAMDAGAVAAAGLVVDGAERVGRAAAQGLKTVGDGASLAYDSVFGGSKPATPPHLPRLDQPGHYDHPLFIQAQAAVHRLDAERGRASDSHSDQLAASLVVAARKSALDRIDGVVLSDDASKAFAIQGAPGSPTMKFASASTLEAVNTPIAQSTQALAEVLHQDKNLVHRVQQDVQRQQVQRSTCPSM